jgi:hypothetical protein
MYNFYGGTTLAPCRQRILKVGLASKDLMETGLDTGFVSRPIFSAIFTNFMRKNGDFLDKPML